MESTDYTDYDYRLAPLRISANEIGMQNCKPPAFPRENKEVTIRLVVELNTKSTRDLEGPFVPFVPFVALHGVATHNQDVMDSACLNGHILVVNVPPGVKRERAWLNVEGLPPTHETIPSF